MIDINELRSMVNGAQFESFANSVIHSLLNRLEAAEKERDALRAKVAEMEQQEPAGYGVRYVEPTNGEEDWDSIWKYRVFAEDHIKDLTQAYADAGEPVGAITVVPLSALPGAQPAPSEQDESVRKAWSRFSNELHRSPDAPYPGMSEAFEQHFSQSFADREWRVESGTWAAAWKAAKRHEAQAQPAPSVPDAMLVAVADLVAQMEIVSRVGFIDTPNDKDSCAAFCVAEGTWLELVSCVQSLAVAITSAPKPEGE